jgi:hypothetical protein
MCAAVNQQRQFAPDPRTDLEIVIRIRYHGTRDGSEEMTAMEGRSDPFLLLPF